MKALIQKLFDGKKMVNVKPNVEVHKIHQQYNRELLKIRKKAKIIEREARSISRRIDTTTRIAIATGALKEYKEYER
jgi:hypothetical protein